MDAPRNIDECLMTVNPKRLKVTELTSKYYKVNVKWSLGEDSGEVVFTFDTGKVHASGCSKEFARRLLYEISHDFLEADE